MFNLQATNTLQDGGTHFAILLTIPSTTINAEHPTLKQAKRKARNPRPITISPHQTERAFGGVKL